MFNVADAIKKFFVLKETKQEKTKPVEIPMPIEEPAEMKGGSDLGLDESDLEEFDAPSVETRDEILSITVTAPPHYRIVEHAFLYEHANSPCDQIRIHFEKIKGDEHVTKN